MGIGPMVSTAKYNDDDYDDDDGKELKCSAA